MKKQMLVVGALAMALSMPLVACGNASNGTSSNSGTTTATEQKSDSKSDSKSDFDANKFYAGQWRGSVEMTGQTVYGTAGGRDLTSLRAAMEKLPNLKEQLSGFSDRRLTELTAEDGTCEVVPLEAHADLLNDKGTWEGTADKLTLHLEKAGDIELTVSGKANLEGDAHAFDIADFDTIQFDFYG